MKTVLCYGDSNTWGYIPGTGERFAHDVRWPGVLQRGLGAEYRVIEEGLNGRTSVWDDPLFPGRNGGVYLSPCLETHRPLDYVVIFLGLNDLKKRFSASAEDIARGIGVLIKIVATSGARTGQGAPQVLVVAPPPLGKLSGYADQFEGAAERSARLAGFIRTIAAESKCAFLDGAEHVALSDVDGLHLDTVSHTAMGDAVARRILEMQKIQC
jgi:lysophospholipase L1-like esterase